MDNAICKDEKNVSLALSTSTEDREKDDKNPSLTNDLVGQPSANLSKNKLRKLRNHEKLLQKRTEKRKREREVSKGKRARKSLGNAEKLAITDKLRGAKGHAPKIVIDCQYNDLMSSKEQSRLAQQLRRVYSSNKASPTPFHLIFTSLSNTSSFFQTCCKQNDGFAKYIIDFEDKNVVDKFPIDNIVYLSPDAGTPLDEIEPSRVYVIGGLVDETTHKHVSLGFSETHKITSVRLPIDEHFVSETHGTFKKVLTVNQVFDIVLEWHKTKDWVKAISKGLPQRTGFVPRVQEKS